MNVSWQAGLQPDTALPDWAKQAILLRLHAHDKIFTGFLFEGPIDSHAGLTHVLVAFLHPRVSRFLYQWVILLPSFHDLVDTVQFVVDPVLVSFAPTSPPAHLRLFHAKGERRLRFIEPRVAVEALRGRTASIPSRLGILLVRGILSIVDIGNRCYRVD